DASPPRREGRARARRRTLSKPSKLLRNDHEGLPHPVGIAAGHEADAALGGTEPGLKGERGRVGHGGRPQRKTGLDKHGGRGGGGIRGPRGGVLSGRPPWGGRLGGAGGAPRGWVRNTGC